MTEESTGVTPPKRRGRGPGKRPALFSTSIRLSREVMDYFNQRHPKDKQAQMRAVLTEYVRDELNRTSQPKEPQHGTQENVDE